MKIGEDKIVEVAFRLFKENGVRSTRLHHVARGCGTSLYDITANFASKKALVLAVVKHTLEKKTAHLLINAALSPSAVTELNNFFKFIEESIADLGVELFSEMSRYHPLAFDQLKGLVDQNLTPFLQRNIERGLREGFYRDSLDAEEYAFTYFFFLRTILESGREWSEIKRTIMHINGIYRYGVLNVKGMRV